MFRLESAVWAARLRCVSGRFYVLYLGRASSMIAVPWVECILIYE